MTEPTNQPTDDYRDTLPQYPSDGPGFAHRDQSKHIWRAIKSHLKPRVSRGKAGIVRTSNVKISHKKVKFY